MSYLESRLKDKGEDKQGIINHISFAKFT